MNILSFKYVCGKETRVVVRPIVAITVEEYIKLFYMWIVTLDT